MGGVGSGGHNKKSDAVKELEGNPGKRRSNKKSTKSPTQTTATKSSRPTCPKWLDTEARKEWRRVCPLLMERETLTKSDSSILAGYCAAYARWRKAEESLKGGLTQEARHGTSPRPEVAIARDALTQMRALAAELGLTPNSRSRILPTPKNPVDDDPLNQKLNTRYN